MPLLCVRNIALALLSLLLVSCGPPAARKAPGLSIAFFSDVQIGSKNWHGREKEIPSSANLPQLAQTIRDIAAEQPGVAFQLLF